MILTTKLPQDADTSLGKILCDADLDYLGREDYLMISHCLRHEWITLDINKLTLLEWYQLQVDFLETHNYFTDYAVKSRQAKKEKNLNQIKELLKFNS
jgi:hypothetical protein